MTSSDLKKRTFSRNLVTSGDLPQIEVEEMHKDYSTTWPKVVISMSHIIFKLFGFHFNSLLHTIFFNFQAKSSWRLRATADQKVCEIRLEHSPVHLRYEHGYARFSAL